MLCVFDLWIQWILGGIGTMKCRDLGLRVLSTAALLSIVSSIAAPAFAEVYYIGNGNDLTIEAKADGKVYVNGHEDADGEITIKGGSGEDSLTRSAENDDTPVVGESYAVQDTEDSEEEKEPVVTEEEPEETESEEEPEEQKSKEEMDEEPQQEDEEEPVTAPAEQQEEEDELEKSVEEEPKPKEEKTTEEIEKQEPAVTAMGTGNAGMPVEQNEADEPEASDPVSNVIKIINNWKDKILNITLDNVNIKSDANAAMTVVGDQKSKTQIELDGNNVLDSSDADGHAGLEKNSSENIGSLILNDANQDGGSLIAKGGDGGAGIGGSSKKSDGSTNNGYTTSSTWGQNIVINGGTITAEGGEGAAGIGSGVNATKSSVYEVSQFVRVTGGTVTATGGEGGAGIGGSKDQRGAGLYIMNGTVNAYGKGGGAGIGGGDGAGAHMVGLNAGVGGAYDSNDPTVLAVGSEGAAGIGGGRNGTLADAVFSSGHVTAIGGKGGAGVGNGEGATGGNIFLAGSIITAYGGEGAEDFGSGKNNQGTVRIDFYNPNGGSAQAPLITEEEIVDWNPETKTLEIHYKKDDETVAVIHYAGTWTETSSATCTEAGKGAYTVQYASVNGEKTVTGEVVIPATGHQHMKVVNQKDATETEAGYTGDTVCEDCGEVLEKGEEIPASGHSYGEWITDGKGNKSHTCTVCGNTETVPDENYHPAPEPAEENIAAPELEVLAPDGTNRLFTVTQNGTERVYTSNYMDGTLTGTMETLEYLKEQGVKTIVFMTSQRTSRFAVADLLALVNEGDVFYLRHTGAETPNLLVIANDHSELLNG